MSKILVSMIILILLVLVIFFGIEYFITLAQLQKIQATSKVNGSVVALNKLFVNKVLNAQGPVSAEDRLLLENAVANTKDITITNEWHTFLATTTEADAQNQVIVLLGMFPDKIIY